MFLLLGAIVNVAVAWGCAILVDMTPATGNVRKGGDLSLVTDHGSLVGWMRCRVGSTQIELCCRDVGLPSLWNSEWRWAINRFPAWVEFLMAYPDDMDRPVPTFYASARGWPLRCLWGDYVLWPVRGTSGMYEITDSRWMIFLGDSSMQVPTRYDARALPLHLLETGFAINTIFYAAILWLLFAAPFALRRRRRIKRGLCPACAYPIGTSPVCTECGMLLPPRRGAGM